mmetsp:Transcript_8226/g.18435  ORF Transcript_8226/g.18435 Transcript_8226/m.18435 type:complete len:507 (-) Transcript_8226:470-1990(-)
MILKLAPSLLLSVLYCSNESAAFAPSSTIIVVPRASSSSSLAMANIEDEQNVDFSRRGTAGTFFRGLTAGAAVVGASNFISMRNVEAAYAAEFSDGNGASSSAKEVVETALGNDNNAVTAVSSSVEYRNSLSEMDPQLLAAGAVGAAAFFGFAANSQSNMEQDGSTSSAPSVDPKVEAAAKALQKAAQPVPYGLQAGRNYYNGVEIAKTDKAAAPAPPTPPPAAPAQPVAAVISTKPVPISEPKKGRKTWYDNPTPYGIQNKDKNPFLKDIEENCDAGKVTPDCTESIKEYLTDLSDTGVKATSEETSTIIGYLDSLNSNSSSVGGGQKTAAFASYLDALPVGEARAPTSAAAVKSYLDTISSGNAAPMKKSMAPPKPQMRAPPSPVIVAPPAPIIQQVDLTPYNNRLTSVENRVSALETKVDQIPNQVFSRMEEWQSQQEGRLSGEVKRIWDELEDSRESGVVNGGAAPEVVAPMAVVATSAPAVPVAAAPKRGGPGGYLDSLTP